MPVPVSQMVKVASYVLTQKLRGNRRYPLVLMLEPLYRCNLSCAGCGKIQYPARVLKHQLSVEECLAAADACPAPVVSIPGGEPLMHPGIDEIVRGLVARGKYVYLCTNALLLEEKLDLFEPSSYLSFSVHLDGLEAEHDAAVCRSGTYQKAVSAIREAVRRGFRVTTNTTLFEGADPERTAAFFDEAMGLGVEGMMISPGYSYDKAPDQDHFLTRRRTTELFRRVLGAGARRAGRRWRFNQSPLFLEFLAGARDYDCTPWGNPTYSVFGWQRPCYLLQDGYAPSFQSLMDETDWPAYGPRSGRRECADCMVHSGFEASAVEDAFSSLRGLARMARAFLLGPRIPRAGVMPDTASAASDGELAPTSAASDGELAPTAAAAEAGVDSPPLARGWSGDGSAASLRRAFSYRGDVSLTLDDGSIVEGFVASPGPGSLRVWPRGEVKPVRIPADRVTAVTLSGRDAAAPRPERRLATP